MKNVYFIILALLIITYMIISIRKNKLDVGQSFIWIIFCIALLVLSIFPHIIDHLAPIFGISYAPALLLTIAIVVLYVMNFVAMKKINVLQKKVINLTQELIIVRSKQHE